jgi:hypothetical protein
MNLRIDCGFITLSERCRITNFDCGDDDLNNFFNDETSSYKEQLLAQTNFFQHKETGKIVCAFSLSPNALKTSDLPDSRRKKVQEYIPREKSLQSYLAFLIGRLGVASEFKGQGIGSQKNMNKFFLFLFCISISLISCDRRKITTSFMKEIISIDDMDLKERYKGTDIFESITFIPLETVNENLIGNISKIMMTDSIIYILDQQTKSVLMFNIKGQFLYKIQNIGTGPNEYTNIYDFTLTNNGEILILCENKKLIKFQHNAIPFITYYLPFYVDAVEMLNDSVLVFNGSSIENKVIVWNIFVNKTINRFLTYDKKTSSRILKPLIKNDKEVYFTFAYSSIIYNVTQDGLEEKWFIDFGNRRIDKENLILSDLGTYFPPSSSADMYNFIETNDYVMFSFQCEELNDGYPHYVYYSKSSKTKRILTKNLFEDDVTFSLYPPQIFGQVGYKKFIGVLNTYELIEQTTSLSEKYVNTENYKRLKNIVEKINEFDNPIIVLYLLKDF